MQVWMLDWAEVKSLGGELFKISVSANLWFHSHESHRNVIIANEETHVQLYQNKHYCNNSNALF